jgi:hypothetical protein
MFDQAVEGLRPFRPFAHLARSSEAIRQFTPNWFTVTMGAGIMALDSPAAAADSRIARGQPRIVGVKYVSVCAVQPTLRRARRGYRKTSPEIMLSIAGKLDDHEIESLTAYYQQLRAAAPVTVAK